MKDFLKTLRWTDYLFMFCATLWAIAFGLAWDYFWRNVDLYYRALGG